MAHGELGTEPGGFLHYATRSLGWRGSTGRMRNIKKEKRKSRLTTDKTNVDILCEEDGEEPVP